MERSAMLPVWPDFLIQQPQAAIPTVTAAFPLRSVPSGNILRCAGFDLVWHIELSSDVCILSGCTINAHCLIIRGTNDDTAIVSHTRR